jgi:hypothetical protein
MFFFALFIHQRRCLLENTEKKKDLFINRFAIFTIERPVWAEK